VYRLTDAAAIEARLLELAHTTDAKITVPALAYYAPCSLEDAERVLDGLAARDRLSMDVDEDDGTISYSMPGRQKLGAHRPPAAAAPVLRREAGLGPSRRAASPAIAALLTLFLPGAGHLYAGKVVAALLWALVVGLGYALILPGLVLHLFSVASAARAAHQLDAPPPRYLPAPAG
jgi:hypothetical protein